VQLRVRCHAISTADAAQERKSPIRHKSDAGIFADAAIRRYCLANVNIGETDCIHGARR
jgi:hypothetical protein